MYMIIMGGAGIGKSTLFKKYSLDLKTNEFDVDRTIGIDFYTKLVVRDKIGNKTD